MGRKVKGHISTGIRKSIPIANFHKTAPAEANSSDEHIFGSPFSEPTSTSAYIVFIPENLGGMTPSIIKHLAQAHILGQLSVFIASI